MDLRDFRATLEHVLARTRPQSDLFVFANVSMDTLDYTGPARERGLEGRLARPRAIRSATCRGSSAPRPAAAFGRHRRARLLPAAASSWVARAMRTIRERPRASPAHPAFAGWPLVVLTDEPARAARSPINFLWTTFTRFEPAADIHAAKRTLVRNHVSYDPPILIDARLKPGFPAELFCDERTAALVTRRWSEYFPARRVEMGDSDSASLDRA